jgi:pimeloyl-ACP methyl ester carboxylesterase
LSSLITSEGIVHYEMLGRGEPVILLHGWINSWDVWRDTMIHIAERHRFRVYALDFWGFGESATQEASQPSKLDAYVSMVDQFMESMGIQRAPIIGHSMGGTVGLKMTLHHPSRVSKTAVIGSPIVGDSLNLLLKLGGRQWIADTLFRLPWVLRSVIWFILAGDAPRTRQMIYRDVNRTSAESFFKSIEDLHRTDLRSRMGEISVPTMGIFGVHDNIVSPAQADVLLQGVPHAHIQRLSHSRHFPMLDEPNRFRQSLISFLLNGYPDGAHS